MIIRHILIILFLSVCYSLFPQTPSGNWTVSPDPFQENEQITITVSEINSGNLAGITDIYLWTWYSKHSNDPVNSDSQWNGDWSSSKESMKMTNNSDGSFSFTFIPTQLYNDTGIKTIGVLAKAKDGSGDKKTNDYIFDVGTFSLTLQNPVDAITVVENGDNLYVEATSSVLSNFILKKNETTLHQKSNSLSFSYLISNITSDGDYKLTATDTDSGNSITLSFRVVIKPEVQVESLPYDNLNDGINFLENSVVFLLNAPGKEFVNIVGSFNDWEISNNYLMKYDQAQDKFWYELSGLNTKSYHSYQYLVDGSVFIADPYSPIILDFNGDAYICKTSECGFTSFPSYPKDNRHAATMFKIEDDFIWEDNDFTPPDKENLIIYEILVRDFHPDKSFSAVYEKLDYLEELGVNAIELMPVNEFDGNNSWGYNPAFHMAIDKQYGSPVKLKQLVNECHKRGIAVIIDVVYNHATGQHPYFRLWNSKPDAYDGIPSENNPFFQISPVSESYLNYFNDMNHDSEYVREYMKRINQYLISEYHIDGFRFDLTKGMTNEAVAENYSAQRINYLKSVADDIWESNPNSYIIFEHFQNAEERVFSEYGIMTWGEENYQYNEATMGYPSNFNGISHKGRNFPNPTLVGFMESHDKERLMYKNLNYGNSSGAYDIRILENALDRMKAAGALFLTIPGPKMIWQFGELGYDVSINTCEDGSVSENCRLSQKKSAFELGYVNESLRLQLYNVWSRILKLRSLEEIFTASVFTTSFSSDVKYLKLENPQSSNIKNAIILANFGVESKEVSSLILPDGQWFDIYRNNQIVTVSSSNRIQLNPGQFLILADKKTVLDDNENFLLASENFNSEPDIVLYPNPSEGKFYYDANEFVKLPLEIEIYDSYGKLVSKKEFMKKHSLLNLQNPFNGLYTVLFKGDNFNLSKKIVVKLR